MKRKEGVFVVAQAAIFVGVIALVALPLQSASNTQVSTSSTVREGPLVFASGVASDGLQLKMVLNSTSMRSDGAITGNLTVVNTSNQDVTVSTLGRSQNITQWSNYNNICPSDYFMGYAVFGGHFTAENISSVGTPLRLVPPMVPQCPGDSGPDTITFLPYPAQATGSVVDPAQPSYLVRDQLNTTTLFCNTIESSANGFSCDWASPGLIGYWNWSVPDGGNFGFISPAFVPFSPGEYTIVAWDDWHQYVYATLVVQPVDGSRSPTALATSCLISVPAGAQLGLFANSTFNGNNVTYANGTSVLFSNYSCPRPVFGGSSQGADVYAMAVAAVRNSSFVAAENSSEFVFQQPSGLVCSTVGAQNCSMTLFFYHYGENSTLFRCGGGLNGNYSMLYRRDALAGITVTFYTAGQAGPDGVSNSTAWDLQNPTVQAMPAGLVTQYYDSSYPCG